MLSELCEKENSKMFISSNGCHYHYVPCVAADRLQSKGEVRERSRGGTSADQARGLPSQDAPVRLCGRPGPSVQHLSERGHNQ